MKPEIKIDMVGKEAYEFFKKQIDTVDFIRYEGEIFITLTGEKKLRVHCFKFLGKELSFLPEKFYCLADMEIKYRQKYIDFIMNKETRCVFFREK